MRGARRPSPAGALAEALLIGLALITGGGALNAEETSAPTPAAAEELLASLRRSLRPGDPAEILRLTGRVQAAGGLFPLRLAAARAVAALSAGDTSGALVRAQGLDTSPLGLPDLAPWIRLSAGLEGREAGPDGVRQLLDFASGASSDVLAREALGEAARRARTSDEEALVRQAWQGRGDAPRDGPRAALARALALARVASSESEAKELLTAAAGRFPDAPEKAADLFDEKDLAAFEAAVRSAPPAVRLGRVRSLSRRDPLAAEKLLETVTPSPTNALQLAEAHLSLGELRDALRCLRLRPPSFGGEDADRHAAALEALSRLRLDNREPAVRRSPRSPRPSRRPSAALRLTPRKGASLTAHLEEARHVLDTLLAESDRRRLLAEAARAAFRLDRSADACRLVKELLALDPSSSVGADTLFAEGLEAFRSGRLAEAARLFSDQGTLYRDVWVRREAIYWEAKARAGTGDTAGAQALWASLLPGTSADVYARWAASALGVSLPPAPPVAADPDIGSLPPDRPAPPSRELLACGLPELAEDAAEAEGSLDPSFGALVATEWGDYRRAIVLLKQAYPGLGTPEEGDLPRAARRSFYPLAQAPLVMAAARDAGLPAPLLFALIRQESVFQPSVRSRAGAVGLMQLMPSTGRLIRRGEHRRSRADLKDPAENIRLGVRYLASLVSRFEGNLVAALAAYNAGPSRVKRWKREAGGAPPDEFLESIPMAEPRTYVKRVLFFEGAYASLYGLPLQASPAPEPSPAEGAPAR